ncbi:asparagine synthase (glutamine-hydrolyzing) [Streptomyces sp. NBC_01547]|uniref:asparagine synthase (glutamine-hydrolyzing) n=1 Tax=Streptomyces sp. NBC_01547 TaxID=2975873 RepID=UPI003870A998
MCGLSGWVRWGGGADCAESAVSAMTATLACRGPDEAGLWASRHATLGHQRLSIIDVETGHQPMLDSVESPRAAVVFGGEIYNFKELRNNLTRKGVEFQTGSDTEVILHAYLEWGSRFVEQLQGMFAIAVWDVVNHELVLARDHLGIKPLYYSADADGVIFASEPKALLASPLFAAEVDREGLAEILGLWPYKTPGHGIYRGVHEVRPGEIIRMDGRTARATKYWKLPVFEVKDSVEAASLRVRDLLEQAVESHLIADVPVSALLSGGLDSTSIAALASHRLDGLNGTPLSTYSVDFLGAGHTFKPNAFRPDQDAPFVESAARFLDSRHFSLRLSSQEVFDAHISALSARDLPDTVDLDASLLLLFSEVGKNFKVALSGEGADELFGGYPWYRSSLDSSLTTFPWTSYLCIDQSLLSRDIVTTLRLDEYRKDRFSDAVREVSPSPWESESQRRMRVMSHLDLTRFLPGQLDRKDRMSMANGVEARVPFCDKQLVEYAWNLPPHVKMVGGVEKGILRRAMHGHIPDIIVGRPKTSYPTTFDPAYEAMLREQLSTAISSDGIFALLVDRNKIQRRLEGKDGPSSARPTVWMGRLVSLYNWLTTYKVRILL